MEGLIFEILRYLTAYVIITFAYIKTDGQMDVRSVRVR